MSTRELFVLGTASQVPTRRRNHNGYFVRWDDRGWVFDPGEGSQRQMTRCGIAASSITRVFITHFHGDHCLGLPGVLQRLSLDGAPHEVVVHYPASGQAWFDRLRHASVFADKARIRPAPIHEAGVIHEDEAIRVETLPLDHTIDTWGYRISERDGWTMDPAKLAAQGLRGRVVGELLRQGEVVHDGRRITRDQVATRRRGQVLAFVMDTRVCANASDLARDADLAVFESTYLAECARDARKNGHLTATQAATIARDAGVRQLVLSHYSQRHPRESDFEEEASRVHSQVHAARDGDRVAVPPRQRAAPSGSVPNTGRLAAS